MKEINNIITTWMNKTIANIHKLCTLLGKLFFMAQCCPPVRFFINCMLDTLRACPLERAASLSAQFCKDLNWLAAYLP